MESQCAGCARLFDGNGANSGKPRCSAFPEGIPNGILDGEVDHTKPVKGDHGLVFVSMEDAAKEQGRGGTGTAGTGS